MKIWFMRQAGRYLPEYMERRRNITSFMDACQDTDFITTVTLQPIERFDLDYAIIFSDILLIYEAMGYDVVFAKGNSPIIHKKNPSHDNDHSIFKEDVFQPLKQAIKNVRKKLSPDKQLIGFSGAFFTLLTYFCEKQSRRHVNNTIDMWINNNDEMRFLRQHLINHIVKFLSLKIEAGVNVIKLFDSWAGYIPRFLHKDLLLEPTEQIVAQIRAKYPHIPIMLFPRGLNAGDYLQYIKLLKPNVVTLDYSLNLDDELGQSFLKAIPDNITTQGNLDPHILLTDPTTVIKETNKSV